MFLSRFVPKISFGQDPLNDFSISLEYNASNNITEDVLQLPELIAKEKGFRIVVCIDEFQQWYMAVADACLLLSLWQQETHDGTNVSRPELSVLSFWRFVLS